LKNLPVIYLRDNDVMFSYITNKISKQLIFRGYWFIPIARYVSY